MAASAPSAGPGRPNTTRPGADPPDPRTGVSAAGPEGGSTVAVLLSGTGADSGSFITSTSAIVVLLLVGVSRDAGSLALACRTERTVAGSPVTAVPMFCLIAGSTVAVHFASVGKRTVFGSTFTNEPSTGLEDSESTADCVPGSSAYSLANASWFWLLIA